MAELSEADKRAILGDDYKAVLEKAQREGTAKTPAAQLLASEVEKCGKRQFSAFAIAVVGAILIVSNFYAVSGPSVMLVGILGGLAFFVGVGWYIHLWRTLRKLNANRPAD
jgi:hypothetical protein